jgi:biotin carboxyl carrier protein
MFYYQHNDDIHQVKLAAPTPLSPLIQGGQKGGILVTIGEQSYQVTLKELTHEEVVFELNGRLVRVKLAQMGAQRFLHYNGQSWTLEKVAKTNKKRAHHAGPANGNLSATMPGQVLAVGVKVGDKVQAGEMLLLLEAMKMELRVVAPFAGRVKQLHCTVGQIVERGQLLVEIEAQE